jgi:hypothetical protein
MAAAPTPPGKGQPRGMLKPGLAWKTGPALSKPAQPSAGAKKPAGMPSNALPLGQYNLEQLKKMAASRGISLEKMVAQMVQQYLKEGGEL